MVFFWFIGEEFGAFISIDNGCILIDLIFPPLGYQAVMNIDEGNTYLHPNYHVDLCPTFLSPSQPARFSSRYPELKIRRHADRRLLSTPDV